MLNFEFGLIFKLIQHSKFNIQHSKLILRCCSPVVLVILRVFAVGFHFFIAADLVGAFLAGNFREVDIVFHAGAVDHFDPRQVFADGMVGQVGVAERAEYIDMLALIQPEGMVHQDFIITQLRVEQDDAALAVSSPGRQDHLIMRLEMPAAIRTKEIVCFHYGWIVGIKIDKI